MKKTAITLLSLMLTLFVLSTAFSASAATTMTLSPTSVNIMAGKTSTVTVKVNNKKVDASKCTFKSSNTGIATVSAKGVVTGKKKGTATLTVTLKSNTKVKKTIKIYVKAKMTLTPASATVYKGSTKQISVKIDGKAVAASKCTFASSNTGIATVTTAGKVTAKKAGKATITVTYKTDKVIKQTCVITVKNPPISTDATALTFIKGGTKTMKVVLNGQNAGGGSLNYSTSNSKVATISTSGLIKAVGAGTANITATSKANSSIKVTCKVTVLNTKNFTVSPSDLPINGTSMNFGTYNATTRPYFMLKSYMDVLESLGGGTLTLNKGTYNICNAVYVPSNVKIILKDGVVINKTSTTGTSSMSPSGTLFMMCAPSKANTSGAYSKYGGVHDVQFIAEGSALINMNDSPTNKTCVAFVMCHNKNISFENITFANLKATGHFVELDASQNVTFKNCTFKNSQKSDINKFEECINLDIPDKKTGGFTQPWSSYDCTPNDNVTIDSCVFDTVHVGVGTHTFTENKFHTNITVKNCEFRNCVKMGINLRQWKNTTITDNTFNGIGMTTEGAPYTNIAAQSKLINEAMAIKALGIQGNCSFAGNEFYNCFVTMYFSATGYDSKTGYNGCDTTITCDEYEAFGANNYCDYETCNYVVNNWGIMSYQLRAYYVPDMGGSAYYVNLTEIQPEQPEEPEVPEEPEQPEEPEIPDNPENPDNNDANSSSEYSGLGED